MLVICSFMAATASPLVSYPLLDGLQFPGPELTSHPTCVLAVTHDSAVLNHFALRHPVLLKTVDDSFSELQNAEGGKHH